MNNSHPIQLESWRKIKDVINKYAIKSENGKVRNLKKALKAKRRGSITLRRRHSKRVALSKAIAMNEADLQSFSNNKRKALHALESRLRKTLVKVGDYRFSFQFGLQDFARANKLPIVKATELFPQIAKEAEDRWHITKMRVIKATPLGHYETEARTGKSRLVWSLTFRNFLPPVERQPWHELFKPLRLNPVLHEVEEKQEATGTEEGDSAFSTVAHSKN